MPRDIPGMALQQLPERINFGVDVANRRLLTSLTVDIFLELADVPQIAFCFPGHQRIQVVRRKLC